MSDLPFDPAKRPHPKFVPKVHVPDFTEAVEGWRVWQCSVEAPRFGVAPRLYSVTAGGPEGYYWSPRRASRAQCENCGNDVPGEFCTCGFYSAKTFDHLMTMGYHRYDSATGMVRVLGQVSNWGKVVEATSGWRAAICYPKRLWVPHEVAKELGEPLLKGYGVPVGVKNLLRKHPKGEVQ